MGYAFDKKKIRQVFLQGIHAEMTVKEIAKAVGLSQGTVTRALKGDNVQPRTISRLAYFFDIKAADYLCKGDQTQMTTATKAAWGDESELAAQNWRFPAREKFETDSALDVDEKQKILTARKQLLSKLKKPVFYMKVYDRFLDGEKYSVLTMWLDADAPKNFNCTFTTRITAIIAATALKCIIADADFSKEITFDCDEQSVSAKYYTKTLGELSTAKFLIDDAPLVIEDCKDMFDVVCGQWAKLLNSKGIDSGETILELG